jgi:hypothetical protein
MQKNRKGDATWELCVGSILAVSGIVLIAVTRWKALDFWSSTTVYVASSIACLGGLVLIWKDMVEAAVFPYESLLRSDGKFLGRFRLNGYYFGAYEREEKNGTKKFRLVSWPMVSPEREAACIRYMVNEGLIEDWWPQLSKRIKEEADWAFLP